MTLSDLLGAHAEGLGGRHWGHRTGRFLALGFDFGVRTEDAALGRHLENLFAPFRAAGSPRHLYSLYRRLGQAGPEYVYCLDGEEILANLYLEPTLRDLLWHVNRRVIEDSGGCLLLHAAAAELDGAAVLLPAPAESGKTTLVAGLVQAGLRYLTDEAVAIEPESLLVRANPKAQSVVEGSWEVLAGLRPPPGPVEETTQWQVPAESIRRGAVSPPAAPRLIVAPRYEHGAATRLVPLSRAAAVQVLAANSFNFHRFGAVGLQTLAGVVRRCTCYRLVVGDLSEAVSMVVGVMSDQADRPVEEERTWPGS